jgi:CTD small phosphatase-like protein 2
VVALIEKEENLFSYVIDREHCTKNPLGKYHVKDLLQLLDGRNIKDIIIVDNCAYSFSLHFTNGVPIRDYNGDKSDLDLLKL